MRVFIMCPANCATGGAELLHQFSQYLTVKEIENYMVYVNGRGGTVNVACPTPPSYQKYQVKYVCEYVDAPDSVLVLPETQIHYINLCRRGTAMVWWLSVNNYVEQYGVSEDDYDIFGLKGRANVIHAVQSRYAMEFLQDQIGIEKCQRLSDYINDEIINLAMEEKDKYKRENICLYNPQKGFEKLQPVIAACRQDIRWIPLKGLKPSEMAEWMLRAKVYIDLGGHPGKDRIPRETAICGCCVITNQEGAAANEEDVKIPIRYKIAHSEDIKTVLQLIYDCIDHYEQRTEDFREYRDKIQKEKQIFQEESKEIICILKQLSAVEKVQRNVKIGESLSTVYETLRQITDCAQAQLAASERMYFEEESAAALDELLNMDHTLSILRESIYTQMNFIGATSNLSE